MVLRLMFGFHAVLLDVETAFLYQKLEEEIYMEIPSGYKEVYQEAEKVLFLNCKWQCTD